MSGALLPVQEQPQACRIAITMGDPNGIGPELVLRAFLANELPPHAVVVGDHAVLAHASQLLQLNVPLRTVSDVRHEVPSCLRVLDQHRLSANELSIGKPELHAGRAARAYVVEATRLALAGHIDAIVTLPVHKAAIRMSDPAFSGHTELLAELCGKTDYAMMLVSERLTVSHVSTHVRLADAIARITTARVTTVIRLTHDAIRRFRPAQRLAVAGLNPHAGEQGAFGTEEEDFIRPAIALCRAQGIDVEGPFPPDTVFLQAARGKYDAVIAMYHDQGHIPVKVLDFEGGVNVTLGLPVVRTSVDHGTAYDIAYRGVGSTRSLAQACKLASTLCAGRATGTSVSQS